MIVNVIRGDVLNSKFKKIAFGVNTEGYNDAGFAGLIAKKFWPEIIVTGKIKLGEVMAKKAYSRTFYALVCHSLSKNGFEQTPQAITQCLDKIKLPKTDEIAIVLVGNGVLGRMANADIFSILGGIAQSEKKAVVYTL